MLNLYGLAAVALFSFGTVCAGAAVVMSNNIAALLAIAGFVGSGLMATANTLGRSHQTKTLPKTKKYFAPAELTPRIVKDILRADIDYIHLSQKTIDSSPAEVKKIREAGIDIHTLPDTISTT